MNKPSSQTFLSAWPLVRDVVIVTTALGLIIYEAVFYNGEVRQALLLVYVGLLGSPVFLRKDAKDAGDDGPEPHPRPREVEP